MPIVERIAQDDGCPSALVLVPTRELAAQVTAEIEPLGRAKGLSVAAVYGGMPCTRQAKRAKRAQVLVATPGRLEDLVQRRLVDLGRVRILILDEADRMLDMGFKPQVDKLVRRVPQNRQTMFFSATLDGEVGALARAYTNSPSRFEGDALPEDPGEIEHHFVAVTTDTKVETLVEHLREVGLDPRLRPDEAGRGAARARSSPATESRRPRCTGTCPRTRGSGRSGSSSPARSRCSSQPTSRPAASTSTTSRT